MWTDERVALVSKYWLEGFSASECARLIGGVTRNAVIGKVHRLGLAERTLPAATPRTISPRKYQPRTHQPRPRTSKLYLVPADTEKGSETILTIGAHQCRWPFGDDSITFCGKRALGSYCPAHEAKSHGRKYYEEQSYAS